MGLPKTRRLLGFLRLFMASSATIPACTSMQWRAFPGSMSRASQAASKEMTPRPPRSHFWASCFWADSPLRGRAGFFATVAVLIRTIAQMARYDPTISSLVRSANSRSTI